ncbi:MAG TPA: zf-HC2 domain-containing protein [Vicinamibacterales bacterium]|nr:zf-HC2 domain-containing protein [Vicinamibacterales bacterium]
MASRPQVNSGCHALFAHLSEYLDGELPAADCDTIARHCRTCARCRHVIGSLRRTVALCRESGQTRLPAPVRARARARMLALLENQPAGAAGSRRGAPAKKRSGPSPPTAPRVKNR